MSDKVTVCNAWILTLNTLLYMDDRDVPQCFSKLVCGFLVGCL